MKNREAQTSGKNRRKELGQALVESALAFPIILSFTLMIFDVGRGYYVRNTMNNIARNTARQAAIDPRFTPNFNTGDPVTTAAARAAAVTAAQNNALNQIVLSPGVNDPTIAVNVLVPGVNTGGNVLQNPIQVTITRTMDLFTGAFLPPGLGTVAINASSAAYVESTNISVVDPVLLNVPDPDIDDDGVPNSIDPSFKDDSDCLANKDLCTAENLCKLRPEECTCTKDRKFCSAYERCKLFREGCTSDQKCDYFNECEDRNQFCKFNKWDESCCTSSTDETCTPRTLCYRWDIGCTREQLCEWKDVTACKDSDEKCYRRSECEDDKQRCRVRGEKCSIIEG